MTDEVNKAKIEALATMEHGDNPVLQAVSELMMDLSFRPVTDVIFDGVLCAWWLARKDYSSAAAATAAIERRKKHCDGQDAEHDRLLAMDVAERDRAAQTWNERVK